MSSALRRRSKLIGKTSWFRGRKSTPKYAKEDRKDVKRKAQQQEEKNFVTTLKRGR